MHSAASFNVFVIGQLQSRRRGTPTTVSSPQYQRNDGDWNVDRLRPELNEMRTAISTGTNDHSTYSHVISASP